MLEGALIWDATNENQHSTTHSVGSQWYIGQNVDEVFNRLTPHLRRGEQPGFLRSLDDILEGKVKQDLKEHSIGMCCVPSWFVALRLAANVLETCQMSGGTERAFCQYTEKMRNT